MALVLHEAVWKSNFGRPTPSADVVSVMVCSMVGFRPSTRRRRRDRGGSMAWRSTATQCFHTGPESRPRPPSALELMRVPVELYNCALEAAAAGGGWRRASTIPPPHAPHARQAEHEQPRRSWRPSPGRGARPRRSARRPQVRGRARVPAPLPRPALRLSSIGRRLGHGHGLRDDDSSAGALSGRGVGRWPPRRDSSRHTWLRVTLCAERHPNSHRCQEADDQRAT